MVKKLCPHCCTKTSGCVWLWLAVVCRRLLSDNLSGEPPAAWLGNKHLKLCSHFFLLLFLSAFFKNIFNVCYFFSTPSFFDPIVQIVLSVDSCPRIESRGLCLCVYHPLFVFLSSSCPHPHPHHSAARVAMTS